MEFTTSEHRTPPDPDHLEVSLFGPGVGECVVVHLAGAAWVVVDSCINPASRRPVALDYLDAMGVDPATQVRRVVATHFHDDHIGGISEVLHAARGATFVMSAAIRSAEFFELVAASGRHVSRTHTSGLDELRISLNVLERARPPRTRLSRQGPLYASAGRPIVTVPAASTVVELHALSPSDASVTRAMQSLARFLPAVGAPTGGSLPNPGPNESSTALWIRADQVRVLLGSDLEKGSNALTGWRGVIGSETPPDGAHVYKVAHHGSKNAHHDEIWTRLCSPEPIALLTPFLSSRLPRGADVERLQARTPHVFCASDPAPRAKPSARPPEVERTIRDAARRRRVLSPHMGQVRVRLPIAGGAPPRVELFGAARALRRT